MKKLGNNPFVQIAAIAILLVVILFLGSSRLSIQLVDFSVYWSAGALLREGGNPYDPGQMVIKEQSVGIEGGNAVMMQYWYPPWTFPLAILIGLFSYSTGQLIWLLSSIAVIGFCANSLWKLNQGDQHFRLFPWFIAMMFTPTLFELIFGQISTFILLGITAFLILIQRKTDKADLLAGFVLSFAAIKPNVLFLVWPALLFWSIYEHRYGVLIGLFLAIAAGTLIAFIFRPTILLDYLQFIRIANVTNWKVPTFGYWMRAILGMQKLFFQFIPIIIGLIWFLYQWFSHQREWDWQEQIPWLIFVSLLTSVFVWTHDQVVLMPAIVEAVILVHQRVKAHSTRIIFLSIWLMFNALIFILHLSHDDSWFVWQAPILLTGYMIIKYFYSAHKVQLIPSTAIH